MNRRSFLTVVGMAVVSGCSRSRASDSTTRTPTSTPGTTTQGDLVNALVGDLRDDGLNISHVEPSPKPKFYWHAPEPTDEGAEDPFWSQHGVISETVYRYATEEGLTRRIWARCPATCIHDSCPATWLFMVYLPSKRYPKGNPGFVDHMQLPLSPPEARTQFPESYEWYSEPSEIAEGED